MSSIIIDEMVQRGRASKWQAFLCWLGTAHYYTIDMTFYKTWEEHRALRLAGKPVQYKCRFCDRTKHFY